MYTSKYNNTISPYLEYYYFLNISFPFTLHLMQVSNNILTQNPNYLSVRNFIKIHHLLLFTFNTQFYAQKLCNYLYYPADQKLTQGSDPCVLAGMWRNADN